MKKSVYILGAGGMARETFEIFKALNTEKYVKGYVISSNSIQNNQAIDNLSIYNQDILNDQQKAVELVAGIGSPLRKYWIEDLLRKNYNFRNVIHPSSVIGSKCFMGSGCIIAAGTIINTNTEIGNHVILNINSTINHDCKVDDYVTISPGVNIAGRVLVGEESFIGIGSTIIQDIHIGKRSYIGAGSVVVDNVPDDTLVYGVPAKPVKKITKENWNKLI